MNTKLITALRASANALENETFDYRWNQPSSCNCGVVVSCLLGKSAEQLNILIPSRTWGSRSWKTLVGNYCPVTGIPEHQLFGTLYGYGLTANEIVELEYLKNPKVLKRLGVKKLDYKIADNAIIYLRAWANLLEEQGKLDQVPVEPETCEVS